MKKGLLRLMIFILFTALLYFGALYQEYLKRITMTTYNFHPLLLFQAFFPIVLGILLAIPHMIKISKATGNLTIDKINLICIGIPAFYISILPFAMFVIPMPLLPLVFLVKKSLYLPFAAGVTFGYVLVTSFKRTDRESCEV